VCTFPAQVIPDLNCFSRTDVGASDRAAPTAGLKVDYHSAQRLVADVGDVYDCVAVTPIAIRGGEGASNEGASRHDERTDNGNRPAHALRTSASAAAPSDRAAAVGCKPMFGGTLDARSSAIAMAPVENFE